MSGPGLRLSPRLRRTTYAVLAGLFLTGAAWWILARWGEVETEFGPGPHPLLPWILRLHGAAAILTTFVFGYLVPIHARRAWRARLNRGSGAGLVAALVLLTLTGWLLYYSGGERLRELASAGHLWLGLALPAIVDLHVWRGRLERKRQARTRRGTRPA
jgi:hypothetical protein